MYKNDFCSMEKDGKINTAPLQLIKVKWAVCWVHLSIHLYPSKFNYYLTLIGQSKHLIKYI